MKKVSYITLKKMIMALALGFLVCVIPLLVVGQPGLPSEPEQTPIDGGLSILAAIGGGYAIKKLRDKNKK